MAILGTKFSGSHLINIQSKHCLSMYLSNNQSNYKLNIYATLPKITKAPKIDANWVAFQLLRLHLQIKTPEGKYVKVVKMCMAREEWYSLYTDAVETIWREERTELKKTAMLIHILGLELSRVKDFAEKELSIRREQFFLLDNIKTEKTSPKVNPTTSGPNVALTPIIIPKVENITDSFISPDLFRCESPDFATNLDTKNLDSSNKDECNIILNETLRSPKINRSRNLFHTKRSRNLSTNKTPDNNNDVFKFPFIKKKEVTPTGGMDEIILATPEPKKPKISKVLTTHKKLKQSKLTNKTLTQMFPQITITPNVSEKFEDSDATYCDVTEKGEIKLDDIVDMIGNETESKQDGVLNRYNGFVLNYDNVPDRDKPPATACEEKKTKCKKCIKYGIKCPQHKILSESYNKTYTGFWDVDFSVDDPNDDSDNSTIF